MNAPVLVALDGESDPLEIAIKELAMRKIPLIVRSARTRLSCADEADAGFRMAPTRTGREASLSKATLMTQRFRAHHRLKQRSAFRSCHTRRVVCNIKPVLPCLCVSLRVAFGGGMDEQCATA